MATITNNGGGATHIAKRAGLLSSIGASNLSDILMVSGGGGGGLLVGDTDYSGKEAGGISGSGDNSADQSTGYAFGQGESGTDVSGGGSGLYGGYKGTSAKSGGAGSGYIGNSLLSNKKMVGYNVPTSSAESTKTESVEDASESPVSGKPKIGNGYVRIKLIRELVELAFTSIARTLDMTHLTTSQEDDWTAWFYAIYTKWNTWLNTDYILMGHSPSTSTNEMTYSNEEFSLALSPSWGGLHRVFPFSERKTIYGVAFDVKLSAMQGGYSYILLEVDNITDEKTLGGHAEVLAAMKPTDMVYDFTFQFEDTDWHHVEYVFSEPVINANYMQIGMFGLYSGNIKNIKFLT